MPHSHHHHGPGAHAHAGHGHDHAGHGHEGHQHGLPERQGRAFKIAIILNIGFVAVEFAYGFLANSTALMADASHNLSDVLGLLLAWGAALLARRAPSGRYTYGLGSSSILAALANAMLLLLACGALTLETLQRFAAPAAVAGFTVSVVAGIGILVNGFSAWLFLADSKHDLNIRGAYLHMLADAAVSVGVVLAGLAIHYTGWYLIDPLLSLLIVVVILASTWGLLRDALRLSLYAVPAHIDLQQVHDFLASRPGVAEVQDLHIWGMSTTESALTAHLVMPQGCPGDSFLAQVAAELRSRYAIQHSTLQIGQGRMPIRCALVS